MGLFDGGDGGFSFEGFSPSFPVPDIQGPSIPEIPTAGYENMTHAMPPVAGGEVLGLPAGMGGGGGGPSSWMDTMSNIGSKIGGAASGALPFVKLGLGGLGAYEGIQAGNRASEQSDIMRKAQERTSAAAAPAVSAAAALVPAGTQGVLGGPLPPQLETQAQQYERDLRARLADFYAKAGIESTGQEEQEAAIQSLVASYRQQLAQGILNSGLDASKTGIGGESNLISSAQREGGTLSSAMLSANQAMGQLLGSGAA